MSTGQAIWISRLTGAQQATYAGRPGPLAGLRFAIKDNIDLVGLPTTAADPRRSEPAVRSAEAVQRLIDAGAVPVGKTNLDQYATGLVGTRSPYGACHSVYSADHVSGGSSSGSAVAVAEGQVDFALGTDTAGSGRVPAAFNGLVGIKPTRGLISARGVVPACQSLDCVTVFARDVATARAAFEVMAGFDAEDPFARTLTQALPPTGTTVIGVPAGPLGLDPLHEQAWQQAVARAGDLGEVRCVEVGTLLEVADLLYSGPWLAERWLSFGEALDEHPAVDPTVRGVVQNARGLSAADAFAGFTRLAELARACEPLWEGIDALLIPVTPGHPTLAEVEANPVAANATLGRFTNMTNLLDLCAVAVPGPMRVDGLPFGVQFLAPAAHDDALAVLAARWCGEESSVQPGSAADGAHLGQGVPIG